MRTEKMEYKKKLIEVALPLKAINAESAREKSIRRGHPSTLHLWWSRKPTATARAVIFASLVDDPSSHPELFPTEEEQAKERKRLFVLLTELVKWENSNNQAVLDAAKAAIMKSTDGNPLVLLDPFAGGGAIPLEAQRLGLEAHASDLNPIAVMINKAMIEIPPKFARLAPVNPEARARIDDSNSWRGAQGLSEDVRYYGEWMKQEAFKRIGHLYPKVVVPKEQGGGEATVIAWIWARTVKCPNPACGCEMPLINSYYLSKKAGNEVYVKPYMNDNKIAFSVHYGAPTQADKKQIEVGTKHRNEKGKAVKATFCCPICHNGVVKGAYADEQAELGKMGTIPVAIVAESSRGRIYIASDIANNSTTELAINDYYSRKNLDTVVPHAECRGTFASNAQGRYYGFHEFKDYFTKRQLIALTTFSDLVQETQKKAEKDAVAAGMTNDSIPLTDGGIGATAYGQAVGVYLAFVVEKGANLWSSLCSWMNDRGAFRETFARQAIPMAWDFAEANPFSNSGGNLSLFINRCADTLNYFPTTNAHSEVRQFAAQSDIGLRNIMVSTDPPYYDNICYADLSDFFYVWMRQMLKDTYPKLFRTMLVPKEEELVATPYRFDGSIERARDFFEDGMLKTFRQVFAYAQDDVPVTIYYAFKQSESDEDDEGSTQTASTGWETMLSAIINAGFTITGTWPMRTESSGRALAQGTNALASSIVLVCRKRLANAPICTRRNFINALKRELKPALQNLQRSNIAPVDLAQSAIGPGIGIYSRFLKVLEANGTPMSVRSALQIINQELDIYFTDQDGELDRDSRFCVDLYSQNAFNDMKFGEADVLARAKNTSVQKLANEGALYAQKGVVRLLTREEIPTKVNTKEDFIWLLTQQLTRAMETGGINACTEIIVPMVGYNVENAKTLAYRLFSIADRKGWAQEAYAYNSLVTAWPDIQNKAAELQSREKEQLTLFNS
jgi:putative DNA methylase